VNLIFHRILLFGVVQYEIRHSDMVTNPQTFISEVGLYDAQNSLLAVGRLSSPINKNFSSEAIVKVRLTY